MVKLQHHNLPALARHIVASNPGNLMAGIKAIEPLNLAEYEKNELTRLLNRIELAGNRSRKSASSQFEANAKMRKTKIRW